MDFCVAFFFVHLPGGSFCFGLQKRPLPGRGCRHQVLTHKQRMLFAQFSTKCIEVVVGWSERCRRTGGEAPCWWEWGAITSCPPITFRWSTAQVSFNLHLSLTVFYFQSRLNAKYNSCCFFFPLQLKTRRAAAPSPGQTKTLACSLWTRRLWSTTLHLTQGEFSNKLPTVADQKMNKRLHCLQCLLCVLLSTLLL